ncbi:type IV pilin protein [Teredinibacter franksiae]|jgi:prepilin-type N-terminal cleavage/methylation domain|uniref:type IV pilin protein n=1 Tax=Teredinibacter franksiae TaxID=2761453 RepID=UPI00162438D6|nr:type IV pilin protein [Teredinibacter franksiae]
MISNNRGFTMIELMIVIVIVAVLAAVAVPSYQSSVIKNNRSIGKTALMTLVSRQEQYFVNNKSYTTDLTKLGYPAATFYVNNNGDSSVNSTGGVYQMSLSGATASAFTVVATPVNNQVSDTTCANLSLTHRGIESASGGGESCW